MRTKRPAYYAAPLRSRGDIAAFLAAHGGYWGQRGESSPLAWNVKYYEVDFTPGHLIEVFRALDNNPAWLDFEEWRGPALEKYREIEDGIWDLAIYEARQLITEQVSLCDLWGGPILKVGYAFAGRSGGWLVMTGIEGYDLRGLNPNTFGLFLDDMDYRTLRYLYRLVVQNDHDCRPEGVSAELEHLAALNWIDSACDEIPRPDRTQGLLALEGATP